MKCKFFCVLFLSLLISMSLVGFNFQRLKVGATVQVALGQAGGTDWWSMFHHDLAHTGYSTSTAPNTNTTLWNFATYTFMHCSPAVANDLVYVGTWGRPPYDLYCLNATTGAPVWFYPTGAFGVYSSPAVAGGVVYVGFTDNDVYALNATTGKLMWSYATGGGVYSSPAVAGGVVYVGSQDYKVYALNATNGASIWNYTTNGQVLSSPAVVGGVVYVGSYDNSTYALSATTGKLVWRFATGGPVFSSPAIASSPSSVGAGGVVYVGSEDNEVYALNAASGTLVWNYTTGGWVDSSPAVVGGVVYVGSLDNSTYALNASTGKLVWRFATGGPVFSSPAIAGGVFSPTIAGDVVYVGSDDAKIYALDATTGTPVWTYTTDSPVRSSPAVAGGVVYVGSTHGNVYAFATPSVAPVAGVVGTTGYKFVFKETMRSSIELSPTIIYYWSFSTTKWNGTQWVASSISNSSKPVSYAFPGLGTVDFYYVYLLPSSGSNAVAWNDWLKVSFTFHWTYSSLNYSAAYVTKLNVHPADIAGATPVAFPYLGADGVVGTKDLHLVAVEWGQHVPPGTDPTSDLARADINGDGIIGPADLHILGTEWNLVWVNTPPP